MLPHGLYDRRQILKLGSLSLLSSIPVATGVSKLNAGETVPAATKNCIFIFLQGGPSHIDLWDPKPTAPAEIRGPFKPISTAVPGLQFGELMTNTAAIADRLAVIRSMTHEFNNHIAGTYIMQTGSAAQANIDREAAADDFPGLGAVLNWLQSSRSNVPVSVSLPTWLSIPGPSNRMPGQYGGWLGTSHDPFLIQGNPNLADFKPLSLSLPAEISVDRFSSRRDLLFRFDTMARTLETRLIHERDRTYEAAFDMLVDPRVRQAVDLSLEKDEVRDRYGRNQLGQSLLLARRLIEAGVKLVGCNEFNQSWDHHWNVDGTLKDRVPPMDKAYAALIEDLSERGMLDETLVVHTGEFGRTPIINENGGRDHWPDVYTTVITGGGVRGGQVHGASDDKGGQVHTGGVTPADFLATVWSILGIDPRTELRDRLGRPMTLSQGRVIESLLA